MRVIAWMAVALVAAPLSAQAAGAKGAFDELNKEFAEARAQYIAEAQEKGQRIDIAVVAAPFLSRFEAQAKRFAGTEDAVPFLTWIVMNGGSDREKVLSALDEITDHHLASPQLAQMASGVSRMGGLIGEQRAMDLKNQLLEKGHQDVKSTVLFYGGYNTLMGRGASPEAIEAALSDLRKAAELGGQYGSMAAGMLFERESLQIGMTAPDIVADDLDGVEFSLSDYRGKVVVLDFWGDW